MQQAPRRLIDDFTASINTLTADMRPRLAEALMAIDLSDVATARDAIIDVMEAFCLTYTDMAAVLGSEFYDSLREAQVGDRMGALAESGRDYKATEGAVRALMQIVVDGKPREMFEEQLLDRADAEIRRAANMCVARNAKRDRLKVKYARVPYGGETCGFCIMLASRGAVYRDEEAASHAHANCDCRVVPDFGGGIEGYDPDAYYDMYQHPEKYPELRDARNARRREMRAQRKAEQQGKQK